MTNKKTSRDYMFCTYALIFHAFVYSNVHNVDEIYGKAKASIVEAVQVLQINLVRH